MKLKKLLIKKITVLIILYSLTITSPTILFGQNSRNKNTQVKVSNEKLKEKLVDFSLSMVNVTKDVIVSSIKEGKIKEARVTNPNETKHVIEQITQNYINRNKAGLGLLEVGDKFIDLGVAGSDLSTMGSSLIVTLPARAVKTLTVDILSNKIRESNMQFLSTGISKMLTDKNISLEKWQEDPEQMKRDLSLIPEFMQARGMVEDYKEAQENFLDLSVAMLTDATQETLKIALENRKKIEKNETEFNKLKEDVVNNTRNLQEYKKKLDKFQEENDKEFKEIEKYLDTLNKATEKVQADIEDLKAVTNDNTELLNSVTSIMYNNANASERLILLKGGYLRKRLGEEKHQKLIESIKLQENREIIATKLNKMVDKLNKVGQIAENIGFQSAELNTAIRIGNTSNEIYKSLIGSPPDYLGVAVGLTGFFGKKGKSEHQQLTDYLQKAFAKIDSKLNKILEGQQKILDSIATLSEKIDEYHQEALERFNRVDYRLSAIQNYTFNLYYKDFNRCGNAQQSILNSNGLKKEDLTDYRKIFALSYNSLDDVPKCYRFLNDIFYEAFDPNDIGTESLALILYKRKPSVLNGFRLPSDAQKDESLDIQISKFNEEIYKRFSTFIKEQLTLNNYSESTRLALLQIPTPNIEHLNKKIDFFARQSTEDKKLQVANKFCHRNSRFSTPIFELMCSKTNDLFVTRETVKDDKIVSSDKSAERENNLLSKSIIDDSILLLLEWSLLIAPLADTYSFNGDSGKFYENPEQMLSDPRYEPAGNRLLKGAARVNTVALIQLNLIYGDVTARLIFDQLWNKSEKRFLTEKEIIDSNTRSQLDALNLFKISNSYVQRNILMLGLNETAKAPLLGNSKEIIYKSAIEWMESASDFSEPNGQLKVLFGNQWDFSNTGFPVLKTENLENRCKSDIEQSKQNASCFKIAGVKLYENVIPLPDSQTFFAREFVYPSLLFQTYKLLKQINIRITDYEAINSLVNNSEDPRKTRKQILDLLVKISNNQEEYDGNSESQEN